MLMLDGVRRTIWMCYWRAPRVTERHGWHGCCALISACSPVGGGEVLKGSWFPGCCSKQLGLPPHGNHLDPKIAVGMAQRKKFGHCGGHR